MLIRDSFDKLNMIFQGDQLRTKRLIIKVMNKKVEVEVNDQMNTWELLQYIKNHPMVPQPQNLIALKSQCGSVTLDYVLSLQQHEASLTVANLKQNQILVGVYCTQIASPKLCLKDFIFERCVGKGGTSEVYLVRHILTGRLFALKMIKKQYVSDCRRLEQILRERKILTEILNESKFSITLHATLASKDCLSFLMEFSPGGEMFFHLQNYRFEEDQVKIYFCEVLAALEELHNHQVLYRDLKPENILIDLKGHICLTDFGLSKLGLQDEQLTYSFCGSPEYMPPEIVAREGYSYPADFYTLGCLLYELLVGIPPHYSQNPQEIFSNIKNQEVDYPEDLSSEIVKIMQALLHKLPHCRIQSFNQLKSMGWLSDVNWDIVRNKRSKAPIIIDLYQNNIHEEFLNIDVEDLNIKNQNGQLQSTEDLFQFFDYLNPLSVHLFDQTTIPLLKPKEKKPQRVNSNHQMPRQLTKNSNLEIKIEMDKKSHSRILSSQSKTKVLLTPQNVNSNIFPLQMLRKSFQKMLNRSEKQSNDSRSKEISRQIQLSERGIQQEQRKLVMDHLLQSPMMGNKLKKNLQKSFPSQEELVLRKVKSFSNSKGFNKTNLNNKLTPHTSKNQLKLNIDTLNQHYNSIYSLVTPIANKKRGQTQSHHHIP